MNKFISILRGINVSGQKKILMADLKAMYKALGFSSVITYIQSGNVIFETDIDDAKQLATMIKNQIKKQTSFDVPIIIRSHKQIKSIIANCPYGKVDLEQDGTKTLVTFLSDTPNKTKITDLLNIVKAPETLFIEAQDVYLHCPNGYGKTKLSNVFLERKLGVQATTRNWKTLLKLDELASQ